MRLFTIFILNFAPNIERFFVLIFLRQYYRCKRYIKNFILNESKGVGGEVLNLIG